MKKKAVQFDDSDDHVDDQSKGIKIKKRKATPYVSKSVKSTAAGLKPQVLFDTDDGGAEQNVQSKNKIKRQATPYHLNKKSPSNLNDLRRDLFSVNMDTSVTSAKKSTSKRYKTRSSSNTGMELQEIVCDEKNNSMTLDFADCNSDESDVFNPSTENSKLNSSCNKIRACTVDIDKIRPRKKKKKLSQSKAVKRLSLSSSLPANLDEVTVDPIPPVEDESSTEELDSKQFCEETVLTIEASSEGEDMEVENLQEPSKNVTKTYTLFTYDDVNFLVLHPDRKLYFNGLMSVTVLHGAVDVLGYTLTSSSVSQNVYSPRGTSHLYFEAKPCVENQYNSGFMNKIGKLIPKEELAAFKKVAKINSCILMYKKLEQQEIKFVEKHIAQTVFPKDGCVFRETKGDWNALKVNPKWDELADSMIFNSKLLITGGKGVGKSTMLRYILNKLLLKHSSVAVIDLDPGQPEFTLPGCISLHIISEPVFGPNYTHLREPYRSVFVSDLNVSTMPKNYLDRIDDLYRSGATEAGYPTIINYVGLTRENGLDLLSSVISVVKPTVVVEIRSDNESRNFVQQLTRDLLANSQLYSSSRYFSIEEFPKFKIEIVSSLCDSNRGWILSPRNVREMKILNYFGKIFSEDDLNLESTADFVYKINISDIKLRSQYKDCKINLIDQNLVAMCSVKGKCYGWGIVCTVDIERNELYIQTPMPSHLLSLVSVLNKGTVRLPPCFYMAYNYPNIPNKYVCGGIIEDTGRLPMRSFLPASQYQK